MNDVTEGVMNEHQYLLHAVWCVKDHGEPRYGDRVIHSTWEGEWDAKAIIEKFVKSEHPNWMPEGFGKIGYVQAEAELTRVTVFQVSGRDEDAWEQWRDETMASRKAIDKKRERQGDLLTIKMLREKWGLDEQAEGEAAKAAAQADEA